ncbi:MAG: helix-hairpin-helix domain-containing protein [Gemmatimonadetes bacterium]|nr:helix-hairpin-helix domain-containing protein [Gemmatimonadota bacterium]
MGTPAERRALAALAALVTLGAGVQVAQARKVERAPQAPLVQPALDAQLAAIDSARLRQGHRNRALDPARGPARSGAGASGATGADGRGGAAGGVATRAPRASRGSRRLAPEAAPVGVLPPGVPPLPPDRHPIPPVDVDLASASQIEALPRIGPALAKRIVADREKRGPFGSLQALGRVKGIGPGMLRALEGHVLFGGVAR